MSLVDKRYAEALLQLSIETDAVEEHLQCIRSLYYLIRDNKDFQNALNNPKIEIRQKQEIANAILQNEVPELIVNFLKVLIESGRIESFPTIAKQYRSLAYKHSKIQVVRIASAFELENEQIHAIGEKYRRLYDASSVITEYQTDPSLLGGLVVHVGDMVYDHSMSGRLKSMKKTLNWGEIYEA